MSAATRPSSLDHVALWTDARKPLAAFLCDHLGMHVIEETDTFTLVGVDAKLGKLTLFDAEGPRERGSIERIALRVGNLETAAGPLAARGELPGGGRGPAGSSSGAATTASSPSRRRAACPWGWSSAAAPSSTSTTWSCACPS